MLVDACRITIVVDTSPGVLQPLSPMGERLRCREMRLQVYTSRTSKFPLTQTVWIRWPNCLCFVYFDFLKLSNWFSVGKLTGTCSVHAEHCLLRIDLSDNLCNFLRPLKVTISECGKILFYTSSFILSMFM